MRSIYSALLAFMSLSLVGCMTVTEDAPEPGLSPIASKPNTIFILADDLGYGDIGANGATLIETPAIDAMAANGVRLTNFYAPANVCTPSRAGFLTGRYPIRMGLAAGVIFPDSTHGLPAEEVTLAEMLKREGYRTAMIGKWHLGHTEEHWPTAHGFDRFFGVPYSNDMSPFPLYEDDVKLEEPADQTVLTKRYTEATVEFIEAEHDAPFFIYLAHTFPHIPLFASDAFSGGSAAGAYGDTVEELDWSVGQIVSALERNGKIRDTLIVLTSDNGPWFEGSSGAARAGKGTGWRGGYRVPFVAQWLASLPAGEVRDAPVSGLDLMPTLAALAGASDLPPSDGKDIWSVLANGDPTPHEELIFFNEDRIAAIRRGDWRLVVQSYYKTFDVPLDQLGYPLLFNLRSDPGESYNLRRSAPDVAADLLARLDAARERLDVPETPPFSTDAD
ncbi:MAG: sulfatase [Henriciella sp.]|nr:sulfatase [Henriciella sp.]